MTRTDGWHALSRITGRGYGIGLAGRVPMFLVRGDERSVLVDTGPGVGDLRGFLDGIVGRSPTASRAGLDDVVETPLTVVLTHTHWDHIGNAAQFDDVRVSPVELPPDGRVRIDGLSDEFLDRPDDFREMVRDEGHEVPEGIDLDAYSIEPAEASPIEPGETIDLGDRALEVVATPGHSPGHLSLLDREEGTLYGGDVIHVERGVFIQFRDSDLDECVETFRRIRELRAEGAYDTLLTSHNGPIRGDDLALVDDLHDGLERIAAGELEYDLVETQWGGRAREYEVAGSRVQTHDPPP